MKILSSLILSITLICLWSCSDAGKDPVSSGGCTQQLDCNSECGGNALLDACGLCTRDNVDTVADGDGDGVADWHDNCLEDANAEQVDSDGDGFGNQCDADFTNNGEVNIIDYGIFLSAYNSAVLTRQNVDKKQKSTKPTQA